VSPVLGYGLEGVDVTGGAQRGQQHGDDTDVGAAVDRHGVARQPAAEKCGEVMLVQAAGTLELADDTGVVLAAHDGEVLARERAEGHRLVGHGGERRY
jgi:hypothetical protein